MKSDGGEELSWAIDSFPSFFFKAEQSLFSFRIYQIFQQNAIPVKLHSFLLDFYEDAVDIFSDFIINLDCWHVVDETGEGGTIRTRRKSKNLPAIGFGSAIWNLQSEIVSWGVV